MNLASLRKTVRQLRRSIRDDVRRIANEKIVQNFLRLDSFRKAKSVSGFLAFDGEADPIQLMQIACELGKRVFVPTIVARDQPLMFIPWNSNIPLRTNAFGIEEPMVDRSHWIEPKQLNFVISPLVAFDQRCYRIGVGGGYYDRSFAFLNTHDRVAKPGQPEKTPLTVLAGFAFEIQKIGCIEPQPWDVPLDWIITECEVYRRFGFDGRSSNHSLRPNPIPN